MKISQKLILAFSVLILILIVEIILNQTITNKATRTYDTLQSKINPVINVLANYESINKELNLLISNRINGADEVDTKNRINGIIEVELTYLKTELFLFKEDLPQEDTSKSLIEKIIMNTDSLISSSKSVNTLLNSSINYQSNLKIANDIWENKIRVLYLTINREVGQLSLKYNRSSKRYNIELSNSLNEISKIILITGILGIILGLIITFQVIHSVSEPITKLKNAAFRISQGELNEQIHIKGKNELAELGNSFNDMSAALKNSFEDQETQINQIKTINKELEQFVYVASHDLQEPLRTMSSYIGLIVELYKDKLDSDGIKYMNYVEDASLRMKTLIKELLDYSRIGKELKITKVDCNKVVNEILMDFELVINEKNASFQIDKLPIINACDIELKQLFQNLINNGIKFNKKDTPPQIDIKVKEEKKYWQFSVRDNGIGMEKKYFERVFVIFQRLHNRKDYEGTGIGLAVCKKIVDLHNGEIWLESETNKGSTFYFTIFKKIKKHDEV